MVACMIADVTGGVATDVLTRRLGLRLGRAITGGSSFLFAAIFTVVGTMAEDATTAALLLAVAAGCFAWEFWYTRGKDRMRCFKAFLHNHWAGLAIFVGIVLDYGLR